MPNRLLLKSASILYHLSYPAYKLFYFNFKRKQDAYEIGLMQQLVNPGDTILDIGANIGFYADMFAKWTGNTGKVICFEPDKLNFKYLQRTIGARNQVVLNNVAVSNEKGTLTLYVSDTLNVDHRTYKPASYKSSYEVPTVAIDAYLGADNKVDLIKMDIQGAELFALKGMESTLKANENIKLFMEFWPYGLNMAGTSSAEIFDYFTALGFNIYHIQKNTVSILQKQDLTGFSNKEADYYNVLISKLSLQQLL